MRMHPVCAALLEREVIPERLAREDRILRHKRNAIHQIWQDETVPMDGRWNCKPVHDLHMEPLGLFRGISLRAVLLLYCDDRHLLAQDLERNFFDEQTDRLRAEHRIGEDAKGKRRKQPATACPHGGELRKSSPAKSMSR